MSFVSVIKEFGGTVVKGIVKFVTEHDRTLLTVGAVGGFAGSMVLVYRARPKVDKILEEQRASMAGVDAAFKEGYISEEQYKKDKRAVTIETVKKVGLAMGPTIACAGATTGMIVGNTVLSNIEINRLTSALNISESTGLMYEELWSKAKNELGEEKVQEIQKEVAEQKITRTDAEGNALLYYKDGIYETGLGDELWYDVLTGRVFKCSRTAIERGVLECNTKRHSGAANYISANEFYRSIHLATVPIGENLRWGGFKLEDSDLTPNLTNCWTWGEGSIRVLDWMTWPMWKEGLE